jgi:hypothetical protein
LALLTPDVRLERNVSVFTSLEGNTTAALSACRLRNHNLKILDGLRTERQTNLQVYSLLSVFVFPMVISNRLTKFYEIRILMPLEATLKLSILHATLFKPTFLILRNRVGL